MAHTRKAAESFTRNAFETTLSSTLGATDTTLNLTSISGLTSPCYLVIDPDSSSSREYVFIDGTISGTTAVTSTVDNRYQTGSAAGSGLSHSSNTKVRVSPMQQHYEDIWDALNLVMVADYSSGSAGTARFTASTTDTLTNKTIDADGTGNSITNIEDANVKASAAIDATKIADGSVTSTEFQYINTLSSNAQTQLDAKATTATRLDQFADPSAEVQFADQVLSAAILKDYAETDQVVSYATDLAINLADGNTGTVTLTGNVSGGIDFTNVPAAGVWTFTLIVTQDGTGSRTMDIDEITINGGSHITAKTVGGGGLTLSTAAGAVDILTFMGVDASATVVYLNSLLNMS